MEEMNDQAFDALIMETLERRETIDEINQAVMSQLEHAARRERRRQWVRAAAFAFGLPLLVFTFIYMIVNGWYAGADTSYAVICMAIQAAVVAGGGWYLLNKFSLLKV